MRTQRGQQGCALVDLIERIGADDGGAGLRGVDHRLREGEQRLARARDRQHLRGRVQRHAIAPLHPAGDGFAQGRLAQINDLLAKFPKLTWEEVHLKYRELENIYMQNV